MWGLISAWRLGEAISSVSGCGDEVDELFLGKFNEDPNEDVFAGDGECEVLNACEEENRSKFGDDFKRF